MHKKAGPVVLSASNARANLGKVLRQVEKEHRLFVIEKRGIPIAVLLSIHDYVRLTAPEVEALKAIGRKAQQNRTSNLTTHRIDKIIKTTRVWRKEGDRHLSLLKQAQAVVVEDPEILRGTPVIRGTRIPVHEVASLADSGTPFEEIFEIYPSLSQQQIKLASIYAKASPLRAVPGAEAFPSITRCLSPKSDFGALL